MHSKIHVSKRPKWLAFWNGASIKLCSGDHGSCMPLYLNFGLTHLPIRLSLSSHQPSAWIPTSTQRTYTLLSYATVLTLTISMTGICEWLSAHDCCSGMPGSAYLHLPLNRPTPAMLYWLGDLWPVVTNKDQEMVWSSVWESPWWLEWWEE
jgi:hypothetical protein